MFKRISDFLKGKNNKDIFVEYDEEVLALKSKVMKTSWKTHKEPIRELVLWGWDSENNPSLLILYGVQGKRNINRQRQREDYYYYAEKPNYNLENKVKYTSYVVWSGKEGHLPSFESVKPAIIKGKVKVYYKKDFDYYWCEYKDERDCVPGFNFISLKDGIELPYFELKTYSDYVNELEKNNIKFKGFTIANNPNKVIKLNKESSKYVNIITEIMSYNNLYIRKKRLAELMNMNPPDEIYKKLFNLGSSELISGLFLELGKIKNPVLKEEANKVLENEISWVSKSYGNGLKRCAKIYISSLHEDLRKEREDVIRKSISEMDFNIIRMDNKEIDPNKIIEGYEYKNYADKCKLAESVYEYDYNSHKYITREGERKYKEGTYNDGVKIKLNDFKNSIQEAEVYGLADVVGKAAYFLDAPRLNYYFKANSRDKQLQYFKRYVRRIMDSYAEDNSIKFMEAMKYLLSSYRYYDYIGDYKENFQFNEFIKHYLYYDFKEKAPSPFEDWNAREIWLQNDQLMKLQGRYEYKKEIWDENLAVVIDIALISDVNVILKACYYILKESHNSEVFTGGLGNEKILKLASVNYEPLANMFNEILKGRLDNIENFDINIMMMLIGSGNKEICKLATEFFNRTNGIFTAEDTVEFLFLRNINDWKDTFSDNLERLSTIEYINFVRELLNKQDKFKKEEIELSEEIKEILFKSINKISMGTDGAKSNLVEILINELIIEKKRCVWIDELIEEIIFNFSYEELSSIIVGIEIGEIKGAILAKNKQILTILTSIKNKDIPSDFYILRILENGTSKMVKFLFNIIDNNKEKLEKRFSTLLIIFESEITHLNNIANEVFYKLPKEKQIKIHGMIIDSPVKRAYLSGINKLNEIYGDIIPEQYIVQMLEHDAIEVKEYISNKTINIIENLGKENEEAFMYYVRTLLYLPNKISKSKDRIYDVIPKFVVKNKCRLNEVEALLLDMGTSNIIKDSERALTTLAKIRKGAI